ncbi:MAG: ATP-dependent DNA helicase RecG [Parcubacteria group bacterium LiPW_15]|nr:MAG: ATP-dependent DNA helicase RecG [Parcubacteria group bacterium LiPW_15]
MLTLATPLAQIRGIGPSVLSKLKNLEIFTVGDLLWHFPFRYEDFSKVYNIAELEPGQQATIKGIVENVSVRRAWQRKMYVTEAIISDDTGSIRAVWFNQPYLKNILVTGRHANFAGKVSFSDDQEIYLSHPTFEMIQNEEEGTRHTGRLVPIYPETRGVTSKMLRTYIQQILLGLKRPAEWIPEDILETLSLPEIKSALQGAHFPEHIDDAYLAKRRFAFEDLFLLQIWNLSQKLKLAEQKAPALATDIEWLKSNLTELPFELTQTQKRSLWEIVKDIGEERPMNRLLQGDVGSGKTVIAALSALIAHKNGYVTAFMAPTEVLAKQHFETLKKLFKNVDHADQPAVALLTGSEAKIFYENDLESDTTKSALTQKIKKGEVGIVIGTHALISEKTSASFGGKGLGLVIIDEQHRFGVKQRAKLADPKRGFIPHFLSMSATPIPRTVMLTIFGDLDVSVISELPAGRKKIITEIVPPEKRPSTYKLIREKIKEGRQAFVVCPRIDPSEEEPAAAREKTRKKIELKSVKEEYEKLSKTIFPDLKVAMLHGQMKPKEKEQIMKDFHSGKTQILVSTSVIEVGVDVPNAAIMMIEGSDRFGLAQLYQLRGRIGRGEHESFCLLLTDSENEETHARLKAITEAQNGFELAERDLQLRGPGQFMGEEQTGFPDIAMQSLQNVELVKSSREAAAKVLTADRSLATHPLLAEKLDEFIKKIHAE